jgi:hypothetical protein
MVYAWTQDVPIDTDFYDRVTEALGDAPMDGLLMHLCVRNPDGGLRYIDVWESREQCDRAFEERVHPAVDAAFEAAAGSPRPSAEPRRHHLDVIEVRGSMAEGVLRA